MCLFKTVTSRLFRYIQRVELVKTSVPADSGVTPGTSRQVTPDTIVGGPTLPSVSTTAGTGGGQLAGHLAETNSQERQQPATTAASRPAIHRGSTENMTAANARLGEADRREPEEKKKEGLGLRLLQVRAFCNTQHFLIKS